MIEIDPSEKASKFVDALTEILVKTLKIKTLSPVQEIVLLGVLPKLKKDLEGLKYNMQDEEIISFCEDVIAKLSDVIYEH